MNVDPLASMRCWAITVELGGREFEIPALPAVDWWPIIVAADLHQVINLLRAPAETDDFELDTQLLDGTISAVDLSERLKDAVEEITGRTIQASYVLARVAADRWDVIGGQIAQVGFRWDVQPIGAALDLIYTLVMGGMNEEDGKKFLALLEKNPSAGRGAAPSERDVSEFEVMAGPRPVPAPLPGKASAGLSDSPRPRTRTRPRQRPQGGRSGEPRTQP